MAKKISKAAKSKTPAVPVRESWTVIDDSRFADVQSDPRFMRPSKKTTKVKVDARFQAMLDPKNNDFDFQQRVDRYGRPIGRSRDRVDLRKFYDVYKEDDTNQPEKEKESDQDSSSTISDQEQKISQHPGEDEDSELDDLESVDFGAFARGEVLMESSDESEDEQRDENNSQEESDVEAEGIFTVGDDNADDRIGGVDPDEVLDTRHVPVGDETRRFAIVNMDWDNVSAMALLQLCEAFKPKQGVIKSVTIYPSEFGKERLAAEDTKGPALFEANQQDDEKDDLFQSGKDDELDQNKLRKYQLERLRYYYAVVECDSVGTSKSIYDQVDGTEYEHSSILLDLRYIPDEVTFDDEPKERVTEVAPSFRPRDFVSNVLQNSNVKLTWDEDDPDRLKVTKHKFTKDDLKNMDFKAYIASSGSEDEGEDPEEIREKYRALLLGGDDDSDGSDVENGGKENDQEMEITFAPGLSEKANKLLEQKKEREDRVDETVFDAYLRKKAEKKKARRLEKKQQNGKEVDENALFSDDEVNVDMNDDFFQDAYGSDFEQQSDVFEDKTSNQISRKKKSSGKKSNDDEVDPALEAIMADIAADETNKKHFDMDEIEKEAKKAKKKFKNKKKKNAEAAEPAGDEFSLNVNDERFSALFTSDQYAIDPTCSKFKKTSAMETIVQERQKRQRDVSEKHEKMAAPTNSNLQSLVSKIKSKPSNFSKKQKTTIL